MSKPKHPRSESPSILGGEQRINKLLAAAGLGSRRQVDELITDGRVEIDGKTVTQVGVKVDVDKSKISVDGEPLKRHRPMYFAVHKPAGVLCTNRDPEGRPRVIDLIPGNNRLFPVGRLDASSTGLILLTNDGELAQRLAHPKHSVPKQYFVVVAGQVEQDAMRRLQRGIYLAEGLARVDGAKIRKVRKGCTEIEITLSEGKNREIRRVLARLGHRVVTLRRTAIGPLRLGMLQEGGYRPLSPDEVASLYRSVEDIKREKKANRKERDQRRSSEMQGLGAEAMLDSKHTDAPKTASPKSRVAESRVAESNDARKDAALKKKPKSNKKSKSWDDDADGPIERLPSLSENPYRMADDDDDVVDPGYEDAILVRDQGPAIIEGNRRGKVLGYSMDDADEAADEDLDSTGLGMMSFEDDDDDDDDADGGFPVNFDDDDESDEDFIDDVIASDNEGFAPNEGPWKSAPKKGAQGGRKGKGSSDERNDRTSRNKRGEGNSRSSGESPKGRRTASSGPFGAPGKKREEGDLPFPPRRGRGRPSTSNREQPAAPRAKKPEFSNSERSDRPERPLTEQRRSTGGRSYGLPKSSRGRAGGAPRSGGASRSGGPTYSAGSARTGEQGTGGARTPSARPGRPGSRPASGKTGGRPSGPGARTSGPGGKRAGKPFGGPKGKRGGKGRK